MPSALHAAIEVQHRGDTAWIVIDRAAKANALGSAQLDALRAAFEGLGVNPPRAVVLTGAGEKAFAAGADLDELAALDEPSSRVFIARVHAACEAVRRCPAPVVARVRGHALGAGLELAACCDLRVAADDAVFGMPEVRFGIPSVVEAALLPRLVGRGRAAWLTLTGATIDARTAYEWGLVERVVRAAALDAEIEATLAALRAADAHAVREQKRLLAAWDEEPLADAIDNSVDAFARCYRDRAPKRLIGAFRRERR